MSILNFSYALNAAADFSTAGQYRFITIDSSGEAALSAAGAISEGVLQNNPIAGQAGTIWRGGISLVEAGAVAVSIGDDIASDASGRGVPAVAGDAILGVAKEAAGAAGVKFNMLQTDRSDAGNGALSRVLDDPGDGNALSVVGNGQTPIVSVGTETRTMADATFAGQQRLLYFKTDAGAVTITFASPIDQLGRLTVVFDDVGEFVYLVAVEDGADIEWRIAGEDNGHGDAEDAIADPGDGNAILVTQNGYVPLVSGGAETRTLAAPTFVGQHLLLFMDTDGGDIVLTVASIFNEAGNNTVLFNDPGEMIAFDAISITGTPTWRETAIDGATPSTV